MFLTLLLMINVSPSSGQLDWNSLASWLPASNSETSHLNLFNGYMYDVTHPTGAYWLERYLPVSPGVTKISHLGNESPTDIIINEPLGFMVIRNGGRCNVVPLADIKEFLTATKNISKQALSGKQVTANPWTIQLLQLVKVSPEHLGYLVQEECEGSKTFLTQPGKITKRAADCQVCCGGPPCCKSCLDYIIPGRKCVEFAAARLCVNKLSERLLFALK